MCGGSLGRVRGMSPPEVSYSFSRRIGRASSKHDTGIFTMRATKAGSIQEVIQASYAAAGGLRAVSDAIGVSPATLSQATLVNEERPGGLGVNYLDRLCRMDAAAAAPVAQHYAALAEGRFVPLGAGGSDALAALCAVAAKEFGEAQGAMFRLLTAPDGKPASDTLREVSEAAEALARVEGALRERLGDQR